MQEGWTEGGPVVVHYATMTLILPAVWVEQLSLELLFVEHLSAWGAEVPAAGADSASMKAQNSAGAGSASRKTHRSAEAEFASRKVHLLQVEVRPLLVAASEVEESVRAAAGLEQNYYHLQAEHPHRSSLK